jgi:EAL domain-containing protein (putative c-di-GMP-specific phosphodiesterase class I)
VELTLDDQGAAHAYFNTDDVLAVDAVKLDRAFLHELDAHPNKQEMLVNLCERIEARGKRLSFEGVENQQQLSFVRERYRFSYQGYGLAKPMSGPDIRLWLSQRDAQ